MGVLWTLNIATFALKRVGCISLSIVLGIGTYTSPKIKYNNHIVITHQLWLWWYLGCPPPQHEWKPPCYYIMILILSGDNFQLCGQRKIALGTSHPCCPWALFTTSHPTRIQWRAVDIEFMYAQIPWVNLCFGFIEQLLHPLCRNDQLQVVAMNIISYRVNENCTHIW